MDREVCIRNIFEIIKENTKFKVLATDPIIAREGQLQMFLRSMKDKKVFTKEVHEKIYPIGSKLVFIYGTPKTHKLKHNFVNELSLRPIIFSIRTYNYNLIIFKVSLFSSSSCNFCNALHQKFT